MSAKFDMIVKGLTESIRNPKKTTSPYDTIATVIRIDGDTAYVHIAGGVDETPVSKTVNCKVGDKVQVRISGGRAFIVGNATAPPTDDTTAVKASGTATRFISDLTNGIFVHPENDKKNGVKITDVIDIIRNGRKSATYGEETVFYEPKTEKIAAKIGSFGLRIVRGIISLGNKTSASDVTNSGTYIDPNGNMATSNIKAHGGQIGNWEISQGSLVSESVYTDIYDNDITYSIWLRDAGIREVRSYTSQGTLYEKIIDIDEQGINISMTRGGASIGAIHMDVETDSGATMGSTGYIISDQACNTKAVYREYTMSGYALNSGEAGTFSLADDGISYDPPAGYTPISVVAVKTNHMNTVLLSSFDLDADGNVTVHLRNVGSTNWSDLDITVQVGYVFTNAN